MKTKALYGFLFVLVIIWLCLFTYINMKYYASVMEVNVAILPLMLVFPIYDGYKRKKYLKKVAGVMYGLFLVFILIQLLAVPNYTYEEAKLIIEQEDLVVEDVLKKYNDNNSLFYKGDYYLPTQDKNYVFNYREGTWYED